jgi:type VI secretion system protein ImpA
MPLRGDLLNPISGPSPTGIDLRYDPVYDRIKEARHEDDDAPMGDWQRTRKMADYAMVAKLAGEALATRSKDLQLAAWLTEAQLRREGFAGLRAGLELLTDLLTRFWDELYPPLEDGDTELRAAPLAWIGLTLIAPVRSVPLNRSGHDFFKYKESRTVGFEGDAGGDSKKLQARQLAIEEGKLPAEEFERGVESTPKSWYKSLAAELDGCLAALETLDRLGREKFGDGAPDFRRLREALGEVQRVVRHLLDKKLEIEPDPPEPTPPPAIAGETDRSSGKSASASEALVTAPTLAAEVTDRDDATARAIAAARFLRRTEPHNPASYLLLRGFRWGELRAHGRTPDPRLMEAPTTQVRTHLKSLLLEARWPQLLEAAEGVMATTAGRGWIDLQRYALSACDGLGGEYESVARAIRGELRALLADLPGLPGMTLMDDMPAANQETQRWLHEQGLAGNGAQASPAGDEEPAVPPPTNGKGGDSDRGLDRAMLEVRAGRPHRGIEVLMGELAKEKSPRARFLRRTQIARIMVESGLEAIAVPILQELLALIETHHLAEWESGEVVAEPMALLYRCIEKLPADNVPDGHSPATLYPRICSLDPLQAMTLKQP